MSRASLRRENVARFGRPLVSPVIALVVVSLAAIVGLAWWSASNHDGAALPGQAAVVSVASAGAAALVTIALLSWFMVRAREAARRMAADAMALAERNAALAESDRQQRAAEALNLLSTGTVVVTQDARLLLANRSAERVLARGDSVRLEDGCVRATTPWDDARLRTLVAKALEAPRGDPMAGVGVMNVQARPDANPLHIVVSPLRADDRQGPPCVAIILRDQSARTTVNPTFLRQLYGLTPAEARIVVELAKGKRLQEVADELSVSLNTVRNQLKQAFAKTSTNRQSDLVSLVLTTIADLDLDQPANEPKSSRPEPARSKGA